MIENDIPLDLNFEDLPTYDSILEKLNKRKYPKHLLIGNGFSISYDYDIFSYNKLYDFIKDLNDPVLTQLFEVVNTKNFEEIMRQLDNFIEVVQVLEPNSSLIEKLMHVNELLQKSLVDAVSALHPEHVFKVAEDKSQSCFNFLDEYVSNEGKVFSTNYDLLLYWVLMRNDPKRAKDGFGKELLNPIEVRNGKEPIFDDLEWGRYKDEQNIFYVHGTLPIFDTGISIEKEIYRDRSYLLENIKERMGRKDYPVFVTAGNSEEKLKQIFRNRYLTYCYDKLCSITGHLVSFGFNFGEYDGHIIEAINIASKRGAQSGKKIFSIYIGVYSSDGLEHIKSIQHKFDCKVNVFNSQTVSIWG